MTMFHLIIGGRPFCEWNACLAHMDTATAARVCDCDYVSAAAARSACERLHSHGVDAAVMAGECPSMANTEATVALTPLQEATPALLAFARQIAAMQTESEMDDGPGDNMSGDDACSTVSGLIEQARALVASQGPLQ